MFHQGGQRIRSRHPIFWYRDKIDDSDEERLARSGVRSERLGEVGVGAGGEESKDLRTDIPRVARHRASPDTVG